MSKDPKIGVANVYNSNDYERGYREGYKDGLDAARKLYSPLLPVDPFFSSTLNVIGSNYTPMNVPGANGGTDFNNTKKR